MTWRPLPALVAEEEPQRLGHSLDRLARTMGAPRADALAVTFSRWQEVVGEGLAAHARPVAIRDRALVVAVDHPSWATELRWLGPQLLGRLAQVAGHEVATRVEVRVERG